jgi:nicotinamidase-related amidase
MTLVDLRVRNFRLFPAARPLREHDQTLSIELERTALLLIDVYHAAQDPTARELVHSAWDTEFWRIINDRLAPMLERVRGSGVPVVYAMNSAPRIALDQSPYGRRFGESLGFSPEHDFAEPDVDPLEFWRGPLVQLNIPSAVSPQAHDYYIRKHTYNGFFGTRLESLLRNLDVRTLLCAGFATDCCVLFTIADAVFSGFQAILVRDCTLGSELPDEVETFAHTRRTISSIESFLGPSTLASEVMDALEAVTRSQEQ